MIWHNGTPEQKKCACIPQITKQYFLSKSPLASFSQNSDLLTRAGWRSYRLTRMKNIGQPVRQLISRSICLFVRSRTVFPTAISTAAPKAQPGFWVYQSAQCQVSHQCGINGNKANYLCVNPTVFYQITLICWYFFNLGCFNVGLAKSSELQNIN